MDAFNSMMLDLSVAAHKREVAEGFAKLKAEWALPERQPSPSELFFRAMMRDAQNITDSQRQAQMAYSPFNPMNQYNSQNAAYYPPGLLDGIFGSAFARPFL